MLMLIIFLFCNSIFAEEVEIPIENSKIYGTLENPTSKHLILIISGSGPTDRNGNSAILHGDNNSLKYLSDGLVKKGFATFRYDKRMIGKSKGFKGEDSTIFFDFAKDAMFITNFLKKQYHFTNLTVIGHSEGALIGGIISAMLKPDNFVSLCGISESMDSTVIKQISQRAPAMLDDVKHYFDEFNAGNKLDSINPMLYSIFRPSIQPFIIDMLKFKPEKVYSSIKSKKLFISGGHDIQIYSDDMKKLAEFCKAQYIDFPEMNHVLKKTPKSYLEQISSYSNPDLPLYDGLVDSIVKFIEK